jgi:hypothetical protein
MNEWEWKMLLVLTRASIVTEGTVKASEKQCLYSEKFGF